MNSKQSGRRRFLKNAALAALAAGAGQSASAQGVTAGLQGLRFHDLRHQFVTEPAESGVSDQIIMALAGHVSKNAYDGLRFIRAEVYWHCKPSYRPSPYRFGRERRTNNSGNSGAGSGGCRAVAYWRAPGRNS